MCWAQDSNLDGADVECASQLVDVGIDIIVILLMPNIFVEMINLHYYFLSKITLNVQCI